MKKVKYLAMLLAAGMFAACSDNLEDTGAGNAGGTTPGTTEGYVKVAINMPTTSGNSSRSVTLADGTTDEYAVEDGILVFFKTTPTTGAGTPEATAKFVKAYNVTLTPSGSGNEEVTTRRTVINEAPMAGDGEEVYALAILNKNDLFSVNETTGALMQKNTPEATATNVFSSDGNGSTLSALQKSITTTAAACTENGFLMLNAPLATTSTSSEITNLTKVQTLVPVTVYETQTEAENNDAASIYVERVVAKVTLKGFPYADNEDKKEVTADAGDPFEDDEVKLEGWTLSVTNKSTKAVRDVNAIATWLGTTYGTVSRFLSTNNIDDKDLYRIYWGQDCNYTTEDTYTDAFDILSSTTKDTWTWNSNTADNATDADEDYALYCLENTMNYDQQNQNQTTTLVLKTTYYADPENTAEGAQNFFMYGTREATYDETTFLSNVKTTLSLSGDVTLTLAESATGGTYTYIPSGEGSNPQYVGKKDVTTLFTLSGGGSTALTSEQAQNLVNALGEIKFYEDGATQYNTVLIRHFDDTETDWDPANATYTGAHLGRYGVLRNNWYEITVNKISGPGKPDIDDPTPDPDDGTEGYINCTINVLSWAKRTQNVDL